MIRRKFLAAGTGMTAAMYRRVQGANDRIRLGVVGTGIQGSILWDNFLKQPGTAGVAVCDVYQPHVERAVAKTGGEAKGYNDFRQLLERKDLDAVIVATPEHWHALPAILACQAGRDVYVEKPLALTIREGQLMLRAARKYNRVVQVGSMQRTTPHYAAAVEMIRAGRIGDVRHVSAASRRNVMPGFHRTPDEPVPAGLDWDMYLGPAPYKPFNRMRWSYHWRWFWDYSGGQLTNLGAHNLDIARWALGLGFPSVVMGMGGRYSVDDGGETPDVQEVLYQFPKLLVTWSVREMNAHGAGELVFHGTKGSLEVNRAGFRIVPEAWGKPVTGRERMPVETKTEAFSTAASEKEFSSQVEMHVKEFLACLRSRKRPSADIEEGFLTNLMSHLGNISMLTGRAVRWDAAAGRIAADPEANRLSSRPYRKPWKLMEDV